jgi:hypothetical protein
MKWASNLLAYAVPAIYRQQPAAQTGSRASLSPNGQQAVDQIKASQIVQQPVGQFGERS